MTSDDLTPGAIARRAADYRIVHLAHGFSVTAMLHPSLPLHKFALDLTGSSTQGDTPLYVDGPGDTDLEFSAKEVLTALTRVEDRVATDLLSAGSLAAGLHIGDAIEKGGYRDFDNPLLEFARHYRNACAHGGDWDIRENKKYGWNPAILRDLELSPDLHGKRAVWGTVTPYLHLIFLDEIRAHFDTMALQRALRSTWETKNTGASGDTEQLLMQNLCSQGVSGIDSLLLEQLSRQLDLGDRPQPVVNPVVYEPVRNPHGTLTRHPATRTYTRSSPSV
ncbi:hypothetical protein [Nesterenkonia massiliensis]|uniref:hypothetical protein n=1 Tax=Nesterenkonia massiliensis TaxID=1232429 RepID=UPI0005C903B2|nr:hypothetical protein [Nesterenkonia massiliensis]